MVFNLFIPNRSCYRGDNNYYAIILHTGCPRKGTKTLGSGRRSDAPLNSHSSNPQPCKGCSILAPYKP